MKSISILLWACMACAGLAEAQTPPARYWHSMSSNDATQPTASRIYLFGGNEGIPSTEYLNDLWYYRVDTNNWAQLTPTGRTWPKLGRGHNAFSCGAGKCVVFGGTMGTKYVNETWYFSEPTGSTVTWTKVKCVKPTACPSPRTGPLMAFDPTRGYHVSFGGTNDDATLGDTYTFNGSRWMRRSSATQPPIRSYGSAAFVPTHVSNGTSVPMGKVVIFGGDPYPNAPFPGALCDLHAWNGTTWAAITPTNSGPCLVAATMAWDIAISGNPRLVVAGGFVDPFGGTPNIDTWYFTFSSPSSGVWSKAASSACAPLAYARGAYDLPSRQLVFFGGGDGYGNAYDDTLVCP